MASNPALSAPTTTNNNQIRLKLLIDTRGQRVIFAEAGKDFVDFLFNISYLPHGTVMQLLSKGSLGNIYKSIEDSGDRIKLPSRSKDDIMMPTIVFICRNNDDHQSLPMLRTSTSSSFKPLVCNHNLNVRCNGINCTSGYSIKSVDKVGYVKDNETYMVMDDLLVRPKADVCLFTLLKDFDIKNIDIVESRDVLLGQDEALKLLRASMDSKTVLTDVFLRNQEHPKVSTSKS